MWALAAAVAALLAIGGWRLLPPALLAANLPLLAPLARHGGAWAWLAEALAAALGLAVLIGLVTLAIQLAIHPSGQGPVGRFFPAVQQLRNLRPLALAGFVLLALGFAASAALELCHPLPELRFGCSPSAPRAVAPLVAQLVVLLGLSTLLAPRPLLRPEHPPFHGATASRLPTVWT